MNKIVQFPPVSCAFNEGSATHECNQMCASLLRGGIWQCRGMEDHQIAS